MSNKDGDIFSGIHFGKWNLLYISIVCLQQASSPAQYYSSIFVDMTIDFRCMDNTTRSSDITFDNTCFQKVELIENVGHTRSPLTNFFRSMYNTSIYMDNTTRSSNITFDNTDMTDINSPLTRFFRSVYNTTICMDNTTRSSNITVDNTFHKVELIENERHTRSQHKCSNYEFDTTKVSSTFTSEFQLVCDKAWVSSVYLIILPIGSFIGSFFLGASDKWGRVTIIRISSTIHTVGGLMVGLATYDYLVILGRFLVGLTYPVLTGTAIILSQETMSPKHRSTVGFLMFIPFYGCVMLLGVAAYFIREWRMLYLIMSSPMFIIPFIALFLDKSPRWLIQQGRVQDAEIVLQNAAKMNGGAVNVDLTFIEIEANSESNSNRDKSNFISDMLASIEELIKQLYGTTAMLRLSFVIPMLWFLSGIVYFGVPLNANNFTNNPYLYILMIGAAEFPAAFFGPLIIKCFGNIKTGLSLFLITGVCMSGTLLVPAFLWWMTWVFALLSMTCSGAIITICNLLNSELFPTVLRSTGHGMSSVAYNAGFFLASFINTNLFTKLWWAFNSMCGAVCVIAAVLICTLPETQGQKLCETTKEVNDRKDKCNKVNN